MKSFSKSFGNNFSRSKLVAEKFFEAAASISTRTTTTMEIEASQVVDVDVDVDDVPKPTTTSSVSAIRWVTFNDLLDDALEEGKLSPTR